MTALLRAALQQRIVGKLRALFSAWHAGVRTGFANGAHKPSASRHHLRDHGAEIRAIVTGEQRLGAVRLAGEKHFGAMGGTHRAQALTVGTGLGTALEGSTPRFLMTIWE